MIIGIRNLACAWQPPPCARREYEVSVLPGAEGVEINSQGWAVVPHQKWVSSAQAKALCEPCSQAKSRAPKWAGPRRPRPCSQSQCSWHRLRRPGRVSAAGPSGHTGQDRHSRNTAPGPGGSAWPPGCSAWPTMQAAHLQFGSNFPFLRARKYSF